ncbi:Arylsulfatase [subsurface metagenome]
MKNESPRLIKALLGILLFLFPVLLSAQTSKLPNIVVILTDDQGYADIGYNPLHPPEVSTPNMDKLAREGVFFTQGYITGNVCSPTRAGLMMGKYQQRVGIYTAGEGGSGLSLDEKIFPQYLKEAGYVTGAFGKWHLGLTPEYNPVERGFDEFYGFMGRGAHDYYRLADPDRPMYRNNKEISDLGYLTTRLTEEAVDFVHRHKSETFFLYLAYNAVHAPKQAPPEDIKKFDTGDPDRDILMAMLKHLDEGVGNVVATLKKEGVWDNTLLFFLTDNGGSKAMHAVNTPLRAWKQWNYEGGIRTPFIVSWPARFSGAREIHTPVISLDILPTALDAAGIKAPADNPFDGVCISRAPENLAGQDTIKGDWKLVVHKAKIELFDLRNDVSESTDLSAKHLDIVKKLTALYYNWLDEMAEPKQGPGKRWVPVEQ